MQIYRTTNRLNGKWYIGKDAGSRPYYLGSGKVLKIAIAKYGKENFTKEVLEECSSLEELAKRERFWIEQTNAQKNPMSYNIAAGGEGGDWTRYYSEEEVRNIYEARGNQSDNFASARDWFKALSDAERRDFIDHNTIRRCKGWYVSKISSPDQEDFVLNLHEWCKEHHVDVGQASAIANPESRLYGKQAKGWRVRSADGSPLPKYVDKRFSSRPNTTCKGRSWKLVDGKRVWFDKE